MTRFLKMSLSILALVLVAVMALTGCNGDAALEAADKAQAAADAAAKDVADTKKALAEATASLEAAIANKADSATLASKVAELSAAVEAASQKASTDLAAAIAEAKAAIEAGVKAEIDALKAEVEALKAPYSEELTDAIYDAIVSLDARYAEVSAYADYSSNFGKISAAYGLASFKLIRTALSTDDIADARAEFEAAILAHGTAADKVYAELLEADENDLAAAKTFFAETWTAYNNSSDAVKALFADYYGDKANLVTEIFELYTDKAEALMDKVSKFYLVAATVPNADGAAIGAAQTADIATALQNIGDIYDASQLLSATFARYTYTANAALNTAVNNQNNVLGLLNAVAANAATLTEAHKNDTATAFDVATLKALNDWRDDVADWKDSLDNIAQIGAYNETYYAYNLEMIEATDDACEALFASDVIANGIANYKKAVAPFQAAVAAFYTNGEVDASKITIISGTAIKAAWAAYEPVSTTYYAEMANEVSRATGEKIVISYNDLNTIDHTYKDKLAEAAVAWNADVKPVLDLTGFVPGIYDVTVYKAYKWFTDYAVWENNAVVWDEDDATKGYFLPGNLTVTVADYEAIVALKTALDATVKAQADSAAALQAKVDALTGASTKTDIKAVRDAYTAYLAANGYDIANALNAERAYNVDIANLVAVEATLATAEAKQKAVVDALAALKALETDFATNAPIYFADDAARTAYVAALNALKTAEAEFNALTAKHSLTLPATLADDKAAAELYIAQYDAYLKVEAIYAAKTAGLTGNAAVAAANWYAENKNSVLNIQSSNEAAVAAWLSNFAAGLDEVIAKNA